MGGKFVIQFTLHSNKTKTRKLMTHRPWSMDHWQAKVDPLLERELDRFHHKPDFQMSLPTGTWHKNVWCLLNISLFSLLEGLLQANTLWQNNLFMNVQILNYCDLWMTITEVEACWFMWGGDFQLYLYFRITGVGMWGKGFKKSSQGADLRDSNSLV